MRTETNEEIYLIFFFFFLLFLLLCSYVFFGDKTKGVGFGMNG